MKDYKVKFFDYPLQFKSHKSKYRAIINGVLSRGAYILGDDLEKFEENLAKFCASKYAAGVGNCTEALLLSLYAAGVTSGDEVISVAHTFVATIEVIMLLGAKPVFADIADYHNMDINLVEKLITPRTKAIVPVHLNGRICNGMDKLLDISKKHNLLVIEDAAQSLGAFYKGKGAGTFGLAGCFSFYPAKSLGAFGDAGAIITDDRKFAEKLKMLRNHGRRKGAEISHWGLNCRMDNLHAAILDFKLTKLKGWINRRREIAEIYCHELSGIKEIKLPPDPSRKTDYYDTFQNYEIEAQRRDDLMKYLKAMNIETALPWGGKAVHQFAGLGFIDSNLSHTEELFRKVLMLPLYPELKDGQVKYIIGNIKNFYNG